MIGVIGGYGNIGKFAVRALFEFGVNHIKIGGRRPEQAEKIFLDCVVQGVDIQNEDSICSFVDDCSLILNCVGPSAKLNSYLGCVCKRYGIPLVDVGGKLSDLEMEKSKGDSPTSIYGAGASPGLSALIVRWGATLIDNLQFLNFYMGFSDAFTQAAAEDYLHGSFSKYSLNGRRWKNGRETINDLGAKKIDLPLYHKKVLAIPFYDKETKFIASSLKIHSGEWYTIIEDDSIANGLLTIQKDYLEDCHKAVDKLCELSKIALINAQRCTKMIVEYVSPQKTYTVILMAESPAELSGYVAASTAMAILEGCFKNENCTLAQVSSPIKIIDKLLEVNNIEIMHYQNSLEELMTELEGEI